MGCFVNSSMCQMYIGDAGIMWAVVLHAVVWCWDWSMYDQRQELSFEVLVIRAHLFFSPLFSTVVSNTWWMLCDRKAWFSRLSLCWSTFDVLVPRTESSFGCSASGRISLQSGLDVLCRVDTLCRVHAINHTGSRVVQGAWCGRTLTSMMTLGL